MIRVALLASLITYSVVVSQPLAYLVFMTGAQRALSASAYIELRQRIDPLMKRRLPLIYLAALASILILVMLAGRAENWIVLVASIGALLGLIADLVFMVRGNLPINAEIGRWSATSFPDNWEEYRTRWFSAFARRQVVLLVGFFALLAGAAFQ